MISCIYTFGIHLYTLGIRVAALVDPKAREWVRGRRNYWRRNPVREQDDHLWIWFHCASLGEFEQGRPVIEAIKTDYPDTKILLSFFSPSGYNVRKEYPLADKTVYLPADLPSNAVRFLETFRPNLAIFVKYEFWHNYLIEIGRRGIPYFFISAVFKPSQPFFGPWGSWFIQQLKQASHLFVQDQASLDLLKSKDIQHVSISGDTRYDRVKKNAEMVEPIPGIADFVKGYKLIVAGSTWPPDEALLMELMKSGLPNLRLIMAPHEVGEKRVNALCRTFGVGCIRYSQLTESKTDSNNILVIDNIGMLSRLYAYGDIAYVGGAFGSGLHNILEPAAHGKPVIFGPRYARFPEAAAIITSGGGFSVFDSQDLINKVSQLLQDESELFSAAQAARVFVDSQLGATAHIMKTIGPLIDKIKPTQDAS